MTAQAAKVTVKDLLEEYNFTMENIRDFLLEIGTEEMPARFLDPALEQLRQTAQNMLSEKRIPCLEIKTFGTPRRMVLYITGLAAAQQPLLQEVKGPAAKVAFGPDGELSRAGAGFAKSQGVDRADLLVKPVGQVDYVFAVKREEGRPTPDILKEICPTLIASLHFPKPMRWGSLEVRFARPLRWLLALYGEQVVEFEFATLKSGSSTWGHRFLSQGPIQVRDDKDYFDKMRAAYVMVDQNERREVILKQIREAAAAQGGAVVEDLELLEEVNNLLEYPTALCGSFDTSYLELPREVLVTPMREHQRYFPVVDGDGRLMAKFIAVRNGTEEYLDVVRAGNERVLRARLADAAFFWQEDLKAPLEQRVEELKKVVWQESLGTVYQKVERIAKLAGHLANALGAGKDDINNTQRGALLAKADLVTSMVYEFPELQGIMGREYALKGGESKAVAEAIYQHYLPRFAGDELPASLPGRVLSLADKMDSLVGCFAIGIQPTGSQDPYALRRQALGICHIILDGGLVLSLREIVAQAYLGYQGDGSQGGQGDLASLEEGDQGTGNGLVSQGDQSLKVGPEKVAAEIQEFFKQRVRGILSDRGYAHDTLEAVLEAGVDDILGAAQRAQALDAVRKDPAFEAVLTAFNRANNLSRKYGGGEVEPNLLQHQAEKDLYDALGKVSGKIKALAWGRDYAGALKELATLRGAVDNFFDGVMVMVEDEGVRNNRLALLKRVALLGSVVADLGKVVVQ